MKTLKELCTPRSNIFDRSRKDTVLDLTDLIEEKINADDFFAKNYLTDGMKRLLMEAFRRFDGSSTQGVFVLTQAMGGGKTHNMIALGLLAKNPELRSQVMGNLYESSKLGTVRVVAFTGRESDTPLGCGVRLLNSWVRRSSLINIIHRWLHQDKQHGLTFSKCQYRSPRGSNLSRGHNPYVITV